MEQERCIIWEPIKGINSVCAETSILTQSSPGIQELIVTLHFSRVAGNPALDLVLTFENPTAFRWEERDQGIMNETLNNPKFSKGTWIGWGYPLLQIENSRWLRLFSDNYPVGTQVHYAFVTLNDSLHILAPPNVDISWKNVD